MSPLALPFVPSLHLSGKDNYTSNEAPFLVSANVQSSLSLSLSRSASHCLSQSTMVRVNGSALTSHLQDSCLPNAKSIAQHRGEVRARLTTAESYLAAHLPELWWAIKERDRSGLAPQRRRESPVQKRVSGTFTLSISVSLNIL